LSSFVFNSYAMCFQNPAVKAVASSSSDVEPSPGRLRTAKAAKGKTSAANLEDFIPEDGDLTEQAPGAKRAAEEEMLVVGGGDGDGPSATAASPKVASKATPKVTTKATPKATPKVTPKGTPRRIPQRAMPPPEYDEEEEEGLSASDAEENEANTASTVITVKKTIKTEEEKQAERVRKVQMGRPWNWGKKTTLVYERKEKTVGKKDEDGEDATPKQTETLIITNKAKPGAARKKVVRTIKKKEDDDEPPPVVLASEDGAIISADALEMNDAMGGTVQVQVVSQDEEGEMDIEENGMSTPQAPRKPKMPPMSAPPKVSVAKLKKIEDIPCQICDSKVGDYEALLRHIKKNHMDVDGVDDYLEEVQMEMQVECPVCNVAVESQTALTMHIERQHSHIGTEIRCEPCNKTYKSPASLKNHIRAQHTQRRRFECHVCSATFTETRSLREHVNCVHETTETFDCEICGKTFLTKGRLRRHKYIHQGFRHYCEYCNKGFHLRDNMNKHVEIMHEQRFGKRFQCNYCGKAFTVKGNLQQHILGVHLRKSLYECPICNEGFKRKTAMLEHMKAHARTKSEPTASMVEVVDPAMEAKVDEDASSGEEDYDYVEFD
jgi:hypothetical protein